MRIEPPQLPPDTSGVAVLTRGGSGGSSSRVTATLTVDDYRIVAKNVDASQLRDDLRKRCVLFHSPDTEPLARRVAQAADGGVELGRIKWGCARV